MADKRISMPASTAGLTRYFEDYKSKIEISPSLVIVICVVTIILVILLHLFGKVPV
ncbi:preprotein translocase subunit Sec61beta [Candidatus Woesearchaeota archaeon]|nr:preprotein translocase subunit Sec61beta [Candidatus Woesearchaeota archaeon]